MVQQNKTKQKQLLLYHVSTSVAIHVIHTPHLSPFFKEIAGSKEKEFWVQLEVHKGKDKRLGNDNYFS